MKTIDLELYTWQSHSDIIEPDWPKIQQTLGRDRVMWLLAQPKTDLELVVRRTTNEHCLVAEFYNIKTLNRYRMMWPSA